ncbi:hypothetical protein LK994_13535 [Ferruginibacter lapsinanis]|uniref:hypothetical protein n=1 Tax=Ferruginibacter lapsinanis TaxID=563172 RepID=UPI001E540DB8|nr:hypothetical protein [Ferruginibacter lapsinanis]UEG49659.1 hypothetical protein LK994_13535 [Ferruginibacter lapsinanis]
MISNFFYQKPNNPFTDTLNFISDRDGVYDINDTAKNKLDNLLDGIYFDTSVFNGKKINVIDSSGRIIKIFDTSYKYYTDSFIERTLFYPEINFFILKQSKNLDVECRYITSLFDDKNNIKRITRYGKKHKDISYNSIIKYLGEEIFSDMYEFSYKKIKKEKKITRLNYYRSDEKTGKKILYASNEYFYGKNNLLKKTVFKQFNGIAKIEAVIKFNYYPQ